MPRLAFASRLSAAKLAVLARLLSKRRTPVEKPMGNVLEEAKAARDTVLQNKVIVQVGTQHRSEPHQIAAHDLVQTGVLGDVTKVEMVWNYHGPRWRGRPETKLIREADTDWRKFLLNKPYRPFDPQVYCEFRLYKNFRAASPISG